MHFSANAIISAGVTTSTALGMAAWVKWCAMPLVIAFGAGLRLGKTLGRREAGRHARQAAAR